MTEVCHLGLCKVRNFNCPSGTESQYASPSQISCRSVELLQRNGCFFNFYPSGASYARVIAIFVCQSVTRRYCIKTAKRRITQTTPRDSPGNLVFWRQNLFVDDPPFPPEICAQSDAPHFKQRNFDQYLLIAPQPWELAKKVQLALIWSRPRAFQRAIGKPSMLPLSPPKGGTKRDFAIFSSKFQLLPKKVCCKVSSF